MKEVRQKPKATMPLLKPSRKILQPTVKQARQKPKATMPLLKPSRKILQTNNEGSQTETKSHHATAQTITNDPSANNEGSQTETESNDKSIQANMAIIHNSHINHMDQDGPSQKINHEKEVQVIIPQSCCLKFKTQMYSIITTEKSNFAETTMTAT